MFAVRRLAYVLLAVAIAACAKEPVEQPAPAPARPQLAAPPAAKPPPPRPAQLTRVTIKALRMNCEESCPVKVRNALADVPAVYELGFDLSTESIFVSYDATLGTPKDVTRPMLAAIESVGFDPWLAKDSWPDGAEVQVLTR